MVICEITLGAREVSILSLLKLALFSFVTKLPASYLNRLKIISFFVVINIKLLNQLTNTGPPPATQDQVINLPVVKINEEDIKKNLECAICFEDFQLNEEAKKLPCKHCFHEPCITEWLKLVRIVFFIQKLMFFSIYQGQTHG